MPIAFFGISKPIYCQKDRCALRNHDRMAIFTGILEVDRSIGLTLYYET